MSDQNSAALGAIILCLLGLWVVMAPLWILGKLGQISERLEAMSDEQDKTERKETTMAKTVADIQNEVTAQTTVINSAVTLLSGLSAALTAAQGDPAAIQTVIDDIDANTASLAAAVTANTPAATPASPSAPAAPATPAA